MPFAVSRGARTSLLQRAGGACGCHILGLPGMRGRSAPSTPPPSRARRLRKNIQFPAAPANRSNRGVAFQMPYAGSYTSCVIRRCVRSAAGMTFMASEPERQWLLHNLLLSPATDLISNARNLYSSSKFLNSNQNKSL